VTVDKLKQSYEDVPYASLSYPQTHPDRATRAMTVLIKTQKGNWILVIQERNK